MAKIKFKKAGKIETPVKFYPKFLIEKLANGWYTAHCLDFNILAYGQSYEEAEKNVQDIITEHFQCKFLPPKMRV